MSRVFSYSTAGSSAGQHGAVAGDAAWLFGLELIRSFLANGQVKDTAMLSGTTILEARCTPLLFEPHSFSCVCVYACRLGTPLGGPDQQAYVPLP